jgi:hypothetical protein
MEFHAPLSAATPRTSCVHHPVCLAFSCVGCPLDCRAKGGLSQTATACSTGSHHELMGADPSTVVSDVHAGQHHLPRQRPQLRHSQLIRGALNIKIQPRTCSRAEAANHRGEHRAEAPRPLGCGCGVAAGLMNRRPAIMRSVDVERSPGGERHSSPVQCSQ